MRRYGSLININPFVFFMYMHGFAISETLQLTAVGARPSYSFIDKKASDTTRNRFSKLQVHA